MYQFTKRLQLLGDFVPRLHMAQWRIEIRRAWCDGPFGKICFQISEKVDKFADSIERPKAKSIWTPGLCWGGVRPIPHYRLALCTRHAPHFQAPSMVCADV